MEWKIVTLKFALQRKQTFYDDLFDLTALLERCNYKISVKYRFFYNIRNMFFLFDSLLANKDA